MGDSQDALRKSMGDIFKSMGDRKIVRYSTGHALIDWALGGGMPAGKIIELFGQESVGKSTLAIQTMVNACRETGKPCLYLDFEGSSFDDDYAAVIGAEPWMFEIVDPVKVMEDGAKIIAARAPDICGFIWDSVAAAVPASVQKNLDSINFASGDNPYESKQIGEDARAFTTVLKRINGIIREHQLMALFINQLRTQISTTGRTGETTTGGKALKFYAAIRVDMRRTKAIKETYENPMTGEDQSATTGMRTKILVVKNKTAMPQREVEVVMRFGAGFDEVYSVLEAAAGRGIIKKGGAGWFQIPELDIKARGTLAFRELLDEQPEVLEWMKVRLGWIEGEVPEENDQEPETEELPVVEEDED